MLSKYDSIVIQMFKKKVKTNNKCLPDKRLYYYCCKQLQLWWFSRYRQTVRYLWLWACHRCHLEIVPYLYNWIYALLTVDSTVAGWSNVRQLSFLLALKTVFSVQTEKQNRSKELFIWNGRKKSFIILNHLPIIDKYAFSTEQTYRNNRIVVEFCKPHHKEDGSTDKKYDDEDEHH